MKIDFIFDFASPNAYLTHKRVPDIEARTGARFNYIPCLLGGIFKSTNNQAPMMAFADIPAKLDYERVELERFVARHKLTKFKFNPHFPINTLQLMRGAIVADMDGFLKSYIDAMSSCMWEQGLKMDDPDMLAKSFTEAGFDAERLMSMMRDDGVKGRLAENTAAAVARGCFGIPTFYLDDKMFFGKNTLSEIEIILKEKSS